MAGADYRYCDKCRNKAFYDAELRYEFQPIKSDKASHLYKLPKPFRVAGEDIGDGCTLYGLGDWAVLCPKCAETHKTIVVPIDYQIEAQPRPTERGGAE